MKIEEYLNEINTDIIHPGKFAIDLKNDLQDKYFRPRSSFQYSLIATAASIILMIFTTLLIVFPDLSDNILAALGHKQNNPQYLSENNTVESSNQIYLPGKITRVKDLSQLKDSKTYIIKKVPGRNHKNLFYVSEIESHKQPSVIY